MNARKTLLGSALVLYFVIAFEVLIMISPFAGFFYSIFNPVLLGLAGNSSTRWLSAFYLPHMVLPQDGLLQFIRVMGSVLFVVGMATFLVCAGQIYTAKFTKKGTVLGGLYSVIRHPQYLGLGIAGLGLSILWPRFLTIVLWLIMTLVYYLLAKDEERRMLNAHEITYRAYMKKTGMFLPRSIERSLMPSSGIGKAALALCFAAVILGAAFLLRAYTINRLTLWTGAPNVAAVAILPEDGFKMEHRMASILALPEVKERLQADKQYLVYFIPRDYVMQGMIADTGGGLETVQATPLPVHDYGLGISSLSPPAGGASRHARGHARGASGRSRNGRRRGQEADRSRHRGRGCEDPRRPFRHQCPAGAPVHGRYGSAYYEAARYQGSSARERVGDRTHARILAIA